MVLRPAEPLSGDASLAPDAVELGSESSPNADSVGSNGIAPPITIIREPIVVFPPQMITDILERPLLSLNYMFNHTLAAQQK